MEENNELDIDENNLYKENNGWKDVPPSWFLKENKENGDTEKETKIYIAIDPEEENILKSKIVFRKFIDKLNLSGKMPSKDTGLRSALIIYSPLTKEQLVELEEAMQEAGVRPKLFKSGEALGDIAIKGSMYSYFKCDGFEPNYAAYNNIRQVAYMDVVREGYFNNIEIINRYNNMDLSDEIHRNYTKYNENKKYTEYLQTILPCNAVQRQILDAFFRAELIENNGGYINWEQFTPKFITDRLEFVKTFVENTKNIPETNLRKFLNYFVEGGNVKEDPRITKKGKKFIKYIKENIEDEEKIKNIFESKYEYLEIFSEEKENNSLERIEKYFSKIENNSEKLTMGLTRLQQLLYLLQDIHNYNEEKGRLDKEGNIIINNKIDREFTEFFLDIKKQYNSLSQKNIKILRKVRNGEKLSEYQDDIDEIFEENPNKISNIINRHKEVISNRTSEREYEKFCRRYSSVLESFENKHKGIKKTIKNCLDVLFSYDTSYKEKVKYQQKLRVILYNIKKLYKKSKGKETKHSLKDTKTFLSWTGICNASEEELENVIDIYRARYLKNNNMQYFEKDAPSSFMIKTTLEEPITFIRGFVKPEELEYEEYLELLNNFLKNGMDSKEINFVAENNNEIMKYRRLHEGMISTTTNFDTVKKYTNGEEGIIFLISPSVGTEVLNPVLGDNKALRYSELDFDTVSAESIVGYFEVGKNDKYIFHKNNNFKNQDLNNKYDFINKKNEKEYLEDNKSYTEEDIKNILKESDLKRRKMQEKYLKKAIKIANYLITNGEVEKNMYNEIIELFPEENREESEFSEDYGGCVSEQLYKIAQIGKEYIDDIEYINENFYNNNRLIVNQTTKNFEERTNIVSTINIMATIYNYLEINNKLKYIFGSIELTDNEIDFINKAEIKNNVENIKLYASKIDNDEIFEIDLDIDSLNQEKINTNEKLKCYLIAIKLGDINSVNNYIEELYNLSDKIDYRRNNKFGKTKEEFIENHLEIIKKHIIANAIDKKYTEEVINIFEKEQLEKISYQLHNNLYKQSNKALKNNDIDSINELNFDDNDKKIIIDLLSIFGGIDNPIFNILYNISNKFNYEKNKIFKKLHIESLVNRTTSLSYNKKKELKKFLRKNKNLEKLNEMTGEIKLGSKLKNNIDKRIVK